MTTLADIAGLTDAHRRDEAARRIDPLLPAVLLAQLGRHTVATKAAAALATQLDDSVDQLVIGAYEQDAGFQERSNATAVDRHQPTTVTLGRQMISRVEQLRLELEVAPRQHVLLELSLSLELAFTVLVLDVLDGHVVRIHPSDAEAGVTLTAGGVEIVRREKVPFALPHDGSAEPSAGTRR